MATDTYGFESDEAGSPDDEGRAIAAMWAGISSLVLFLMGPCMCYLPMFLALPVGVYSIYQGIGVPANAPASFRHMAWGGILTGVVGSGFSGLFLLFLVMYFMMIFVFAGIGAFAQN